MIKAAILLLSLLMTLFINAQTANINSEDKTSYKEEIIVNQKLIDKFNNADYSAEQLSFNDILANYSFENIKLISEAYQNGTIEKPSTQAIDSYLASIKSDPDYNKSLGLFTERKELASK